jgi:hypothetical protein
MILEKLLKPSTQVMRASPTYGFVILFYIVRTWDLYSQLSTHLLAIFTFSINIPREVNGFIDDLFVLVHFQDNAVEMSNGM